MSRRNKKRVDYASFGDDDIDDDFAEFTPPASKKAKMSKDSKLKKKPQEEAENDKRKPPKRRPTIDDTMFERELQVAMEMSICESQGSKEEDEEEKNKDKENTRTDLPVIHDEISRDESKQQTGDVAKQQSKNSISPVHDQKPNKIKTECDEDEIVVLETDIVEETKGRRRAATKKVIVDDSDDDNDDDDAGSDFDIKDAGGDDSDDADDGDFPVDDGDDDSDFDAGKGKKKKTEKTKKKIVTPKGNKDVPTKNKPKAVLQPKSSATVNKASPLTGRGNKAPSKSSVKTTPVPSRPAVSSPIPRWNPPGPAQQKSSDTSCGSLKSPSSGLRLGLSRNIRLKPLHSKVKVQH